MSYIDKRILPSLVADRSDGHVAEVIAYALRCPDCCPFTADDLSPFVSKAEQSTAMLVRMSSALKAEIAAVADKEHIPDAAAARKLIREALDARRSAAGESGGSST
jgi:hypothetical protein